MTISAENKALAVYLRSMIGGRPSVSKFWDDAHHASIDIMRVEKAPDEHISTVSTLGLSDTDIGLEADGRSLRVELLMSYRTSQNDGENILSTCAFNVINSAMPINPGVIFPRVVELYRPSSSMVHILFSSPYLWDLQTQDFTTKKVAWLVAIPISDAEYDLARSEGSDALENLLEERNADVFDLDRQSVL
jgi:hypothetical protein